MLLRTATVVLLALATVSVHGQSLNVLDKDRICTQWLIVTGSQININTDTSICRSPLAYELNLVSNQYFVRFCCTYQTAQTTTAAPIGPLPSGCGRQAVAPIRTRIVNGLDAAAHSWPWLVSLQLRGGHFCGGTLIDEYHVLTAAHCLHSDDIDHGSVTIVAGLHQRTKPNADRIQRRPIGRVFIHEQYDPIRTENDVAIIRLATPMVLNSYVNIACLPGKEPSVNDNVIVAGWGTTSYGGNVADILQQASISIMNNCHLVYNFDNSKQICAGHPQYLKDSCQGDSGGPLVHEVSGQWVVSGVVSYGDECAKQGSPGVYARVSHYLPWIRSKIGTA